MEQSSAYDRRSGPSLFFSGRVCKGALSSEYIAALAQWAATERNKTPNIGNEPADCGAAGPCHLTSSLKTMTYYFSQGNCPFQRTADIFSDLVWGKSLSVETF